MSESASENGSNGSEVIDLGSDQSQVTFQIGGTKFSCFPLDELNVIARRCKQPDGKPELQNDEFWEVCKNRLKELGVVASIHKAAQWYDALLIAWERQEHFFDGSPASSGSTEPVPAASTGGKSSGSKTSRKVKPASLKSFKTASKRKN